MRWTPLGCRAPGGVKVGALGRVLHMDVSELSWAKSVGDGDLDARTECATQKQGLKVENSGKVMETHWK